MARIHNKQDDFINQVREEVEAKAAQQRWETAEVKQIRRIIDDLVALQMDSPGQFDALVRRISWAAKHVATPGADNTSARIGVSVYRTDDLSNPNWRATPISAAERDLSDELRADELGELVAEVLHNAWAAGNDPTSLTLQMTFGTAYDLQPGLGAVDHDNKPIACGDYVEFWPHGEDMGDRDSKRRAIFMFNLPNGTSTLMDGPTKTLYVGNNTRPMSRVKADDGKTEAMQESVRIRFEGLEL